MGTSVEKLSAIGYQLSEKGEKQSKTFLATTFCHPEDPSMHFRLTRHRPENFFEALQSQGSRFISSFILHRSSASNEIPRLRNFEVRAE
jgi:hypothetical protein